MPIAASPDPPAFVDPTTRSLIEALEACQLNEFHHREHVRVAWGMLREGGVSATLERYPAAIRRFAHHVGAAGLYHETVTWAFLFLVHERMADLPPRHTWPEFASVSQDLLLDHRATMLRHYTAERLDSELARRTFLLPGPIEASPIQSCSADNLEAPSR